MALRSLLRLWCYINCLMLLEGLANLTDFAHAQIVHEDTTMGGEGSRITRDVVIRGVPSDRIEGGARRGSNLFHSFEQFGVSVGRGVYFNNPAGVEAIFSRVTGSNRSVINGRIGIIQEGSSEAIGNANLFLINPNGILFGRHASLDIGGSFAATTADAILLGDHDAFSALSPQIPSSLLSVDPSAFLFSRAAPGAIVNQSIAPPDSNAARNAVFGLGVPNGQSLLFLGGKIDLDGGGLYALNGQIHLVAVTGNSIVGLNTEHDLEFSHGSADADISLTNGAEITGRDIQLHSRNLLLRGGSAISASPQEIGAAGNLQVTASGTVQLSDVPGSGLRSSLSTQTAGAVNAGRLSVTARRLILSGGAVISTGTAQGSSGQGGQLTIQVFDSVQLSGNDGTAQGRSGLFSTTNGSGDAGSLRISTRRLLVRDGAQISAGTFSDSSGDGGNLVIHAAESIELIGTSTNPDDQGNYVLSGLFASSQGTGDAGNLTIRTGNLTVQSGAQVQTIAFGNSNNFAGNLRVNASDSILIEGVSQDDQQSGLLATALEQGFAGNIVIRTPQLIIRNGATVSAEAGGTGSAGNIAVQNATVVSVENSSILTSASNGQGGDIQILTDTLLLANSGIGAFANDSGNAGDILIQTPNELNAIDSLISTTSSRSSGGAIEIIAGDIHLLGSTDITTDVAQGTGGGGNITLTANSILAFGDSDITASADIRAGEGGDITFNTPAFFANQYPLNESDSEIDNNDRADVDATGLRSGTVTAPDVTFIQNSLAELPEVSIDTETLIANSCVIRSREQGGSFVITGGGSLPLRPGDPAISPYPTGTVRSIPSNTEQGQAWQMGDPIVEPQGIYKLTNGRIVMSRECS